MSAITTPSDTLLTSNNDANCSRKRQAVEVDSMREKLLRDQDLADVKKYRDHLPTAIAFLRACITEAAINQLDDDAAYIAAVGRHDLLGIYAQIIHMALFSGIGESKFARIAKNTLETDPSYNFIASKMPLPEWCNLYARTFLLLKFAGVAEINDTYIVDTMINNLPGHEPFTDIRKSVRSANLKTSLPDFTKLLLDAHHLHNALQPTDIHNNPSRTKSTQLTEEHQALISTQIMLMETMKESMNHTKTRTPRTAAPSNGTVACNNYTQGHCQYADLCRFSHGTKDPRIGPNGMFTTAHQEAITQAFNARRPGRGSLRTTQGNKQTKPTDKKSTTILSLQLTQKALATAEAHNAKLQELLTQSGYVDESN